MKSLFFKSRLFILLILLILGILPAAGQDHDVHYNALLNTDYAFIVAVGTASNTSVGTINIIFDDPVVTAGNVFWDFGTTSSTGSCGAVTSSENSKTYNNITVTLPSDATPDDGVPAELAVQISTTGPLTEECTLSFILHVSTVAGNIPITRKFIVKVVRPRDVVLVLDNSGSMRLKAGSGPGAIPRWDALKNAASLFMSKFEDFHIPGDRISLVYFSTDADGMHFNNGNFLPVTDPGLSSSSKSQVETNMGTKGTDDMTAIGLGLLNAKTKLSTSTNKKIVLLFTDGQQNITPFVNTGTGTDGSPIGSLPGSHAGTDAINVAGGKILTIGLGVVGEPASLLQSIATNNKSLTDPVGFQNTTTGEETEVDLLNFFSSTVPTILSNSSPQLVDMRRGVATVEQAIVEKFTINKSINKLFFEIVGLAESRITSVKKNGVEKLFLGQVTNGPKYITFSIAMRDTTTSEGEWEITTIPFSNGNYYIAATVDDHLVKYKAGAGNNFYKIDDVFKPVVKLSYIDEPIKDAIVKAYILEPKDLGDLLARSDFMPKPSKDEDLSLSEQKYLALLQDTAFVNKLRATNRIIDLNYNDSNSTYSGNYTFKDNSGIYQVIYKIEANSSATGKIVRYEQQSVWVRFADIDLEKSSVVFTSSPFVLILRPMTKNGKYVGPGFQNSFHFNSTAAQISNIKDNLDGSYTITFTGDPNATGELSILDAKIYQGKLSHIAEGNGMWTQWWFWGVLILVLIIIIYLVTKKKNTP